MCPGIVQCTTCAPVPGSSWLLPLVPKPAQSQPFPSSALMGVNDRKTQKTGKDVLGWPSPGEHGRCGPRQHSWGRPVLHSAAEAVAVQTLRASHTVVPTSLASQPDPSSTSSSPSLSFPLGRGSVVGHWQGGLVWSLSPGQKGALGWLGMQGENEWPCK